MTNLDALYLRDLATRVADNATQARLLRIADNLQRMDEANAILSQNRTYEQGVRDTELRIYGRSNVLQDGPAGEQLAGQRALDSLTSVKVKRLPTGARALDDKPHLFGSAPPARRVPEPKAEAPRIALDLSFLEDL